MNEFMMSIMQIVCSGMMNIPLNYFHLFVQQGDAELASSFDALRYSLCCRLRKLNAEWVYEEMSTVTPTCCLVGSLALISTNVNCL